MLRAVIFIASSLHYVERLSSSLHSVEGCHLHCVTFTNRMTCAQDGQVQADQEGDGPPKVDPELYEGVTVKNVSAC